MLRTDCSGETNFTLLVPAHPEPESINTVAIVIIVIYFSTVLQLAYVSEREGGGRKALDASNAAHKMLMALGTHHSHGMLPTLEGRGDHETEPEGEEDYQKSSTSAGQLLPVNHQLQIPCCLKQSLQSNGLLFQHFSSYHSDCCKQDLWSS